MDTSSPKFLDKKWNLHWEAICKKVSLNQLYYAASPTSADEWLISHYPFICRILEKLPPKSRVVDAGCGLGEWVFLFQRKGFQAFGIDIAQKTILRLNEFVKKKKISNIKFLLGDLRNLSLKDKFFDAMFSFGVIEHFYDKESVDKILSEANRTLKKNGVFFLSFPNPYCFSRYTRFVYKHLPGFIRHKLPEWDFGYERSYTPEQVSRILALHNFRILEKGIVPNGQLFGSFLKYIPGIGVKLYQIVSRVSFAIEQKSNRLGFIAYVLAAKVK